MASQSQTSMLEEMTRSVDQWCSHLSLANVVVPKFNSCANVYDFLTEYEDATASVSDDLKSKLLGRSFPPGCHRAWYENELKPLVKENKPWSDIRSIIIDRFSVQCDRDRHFARLRELKFDPDGSKMLQDFVDDMVYSYKKAYPKDKDTESCIAFIKSSLPQSLQAQLSVNSDYRDAKDIETLKRAAKHYDLGQTVRSGHSRDGKTASELVSLMKDLMSSFRKELDGYRKDNEATRNAVVAAIQSNITSKSFRDTRPDRDRSPQRFRYSRRSPSPGYARRTPSPRRQDQSYNANRRYENRGESSQDPTNKNNVRSSAPSDGNANVRSSMQQVITKDSACHLRRAPNATKTHGIGTDIAINI